jgi:diguanylate cyclase (GGDEF)-like protein
MNSVRSIRGYFARRPDPYAGGDLQNAERLASILFSFLTVLTAVTLALRPPTDPLGGAGWAIALPIVAGGVALVLALRRRLFTSWTALLAIGYVTVASIAALQWLGGGGDDPYGHLLLAPVFFVAALQPPRRILGFLIFLAAAMALPLLYGGLGADEADALIVTFVIFAGLSLAMNVTMTAIRGQRVTHRAEEAAARQEARLDMLTGLYNRRAFDEALGREVKNARRLELPLSVAMIDIENFKEVNDRWSYTEGDRCLRELGVALRDALRDPDYCFRWGGDEFALILPGTPSADTEALAERLSSEVSATCRRPDDEPIRIRFAVAQLVDDQSPAELVRMAGLALTSARAQTTNATSST